MVINSNKGTCLTFNLCYVMNGLILIRKVRKISKLELVSNLTKNERSCKVPYLITPFPGLLMRRDLRLIEVFIA